MLAPATDGELAEVAAFVNAGFRGDSARKGWSHEADLLGGTRTGAATLRRNLVARPRARLLLLREDGALEGCVWLEPKDAGAWQLGMLTVRPDAQARGTGRRLLAAAEAVVRAEGARAIEMTVIGIREELIAWYLRRGYRPTGEKRPFIHDGEHRPDLTFVVLEKAIGSAEDDLPLNKA